MLKCTLALTLTGDFFHQGKYLLPPPIRFKLNKQNVAGMSLTFNVVPLTCPFILTNLLVAFLVPSGNNVAMFLGAVGIACLLHNLSYSHR